MNRNRLRLVLLVAIAALVLGVTSTAVLAAAGPVRPHRPYVSAWASCEVPALPGTVVNVTLTDMPGTMMGPGRTGSYGPGMMGPGAGSQNGPGAPLQDYPRPGMRMMSILADPTNVPTGQVSFRVVNSGAWIHELTLLPLGAGQDIGQRSIGADNQVDETAALIHAARTCDTGEGDGIVPGGIGWATATLVPGRYELICNIAGHYWAGMYNELTVTG